MKTSRLLLAASAIAAIISSCTRNIYAPYCQPVTLFNQQGEYQITAAVSDEFFNSGVSNYTDSTASTHRTHLNYETSGHNFVAQGAYAITDYLAVAGGLSLYRKGNKDVQNLTDYDAINYGEVAAGYYKPINTQLTFEVYAGTGLSSQKHKFSTAGWANLKSSKIFIQPNFGYTSPIFDVGASARMSYLKYFGLKNNINPTNSSWAMGDHLYMNQIGQNSGFWLLEPTITVRVGWKFIKATYQLTYLVQLNNHDYILHGHGVASYRHYVGLTYTFGHKYE